jgi:hypothetical protein
MIQSIGTLYAIQDLFEHLGLHAVAREEFLDGFLKYGSSTAKDVYETATRLSWICTADSGQLVPTEGGKIAHQGLDRTTKLRHQLASIIETTRPAWAGLLQKGRKEAQAGLPDEIRQCFEEALLLDEATEDIIIWWDRLSCLMREFSQRKLLETGRKGERLSIAYEEKRTQTPPKWQSIETNYAGYDVLSIREKGDSTVLKIEVKASDRTFKNAQIHVTEHEWITASHAFESYVFHVWVLQPEPTLFVVPSSTVLTHVPNNKGKGCWKNACIPLGALTHPSKGFRN